MTLILASSSPIRTAILAGAGVEHQTIPAGIGERALKSGLERPDEIASVLAREKALAVSRARPGDWVIGSDSVASVGSRIFDKPNDRDEATVHLRLFSSRMMHLTSAVALARDGAIDWVHCDMAELQVRTLSEQFIADYLAAEWPDVGYCVGVFRIEGRGVQLFERIKGDHFTILGMPLLPLLGALRDRGILPA